MDDALRTFWLSFATENEFVGVAIVDLCKDEIGTEKPIFAAISKTIRLKINPGPGTSVQTAENLRYS